MPFSKSPVTTSLAVLIIGVAVIMIWPGLWEKAVAAGGLWPQRFNGTEAADTLQAMLLPVWITPISAAFLHHSIFHALLNVILLTIVGRPIERILGWQGLLALYITGILIAALAAVIFVTTLPTIGANGGVSALIGAYMILMPTKEPKAWRNISAKVVRPLQLAFMWVLLNLVVALLDTTSGLSIFIYSQIAGFFTGLFLARPLLLWRYRKA